MRFLSSRRLWLTRRYFACEFLSGANKSCTTTSEKGAEAFEGEGAINSEETPEETNASSPYSVHRLVKKPSLSLPTVSPPQYLSNSLKRLLSWYPSKILTADGQLLARHLLTRQPSTGVEEKRRRKGEKEERVVSGTTSATKLIDIQEQHSAQTVIRYGKREAIAYAASRLQAVYGTTLRVFNELAQREPSFKPETLLDFGSGLGSTLWAAHHLWGGSIYEYQCIDSSQEMGQLAEALRCGGEKPDWEMGSAASASRQAIKGVHFRQYLPVSNKVLYDVVVSAFSLADLPSEKLRRLTLTSLWGKTNNFLVLIEHGNSGGFNIIAEAREWILKESKGIVGETETTVATTNGEQECTRGHVFAPCPHDAECPLRGSKSHCHFAQRVQLAYSERNSPGLKSKGFHIENFSYVVLKKGPRIQQAEGPEARLLQPVKKRSRHVVCRVCCDDGKAKEMVLTKSKHRDVYRETRQSEWGDMVRLPANPIMKTLASFNKPDSESAREAVHEDQTP